MEHAFIFDMDGTLVDTESLWVRALEAFMAARDAPIDHATSMRIVYGRSWRDIYTDLVRLYPAQVTPMDEMDLELRSFLEAQRDACDVRIQPSIDLLHELAQDYPVCIVSGSPRGGVDREVALMEIGDRLAFTLSAEDYAPGKPDPAGFRLAADRFGIAPERCMVFEDSSAGVAAARAAGMPCVALQRASAPPQDVAAATLVVASLAEVTRDVRNRLFEESL